MHSQASISTVGWVALLCSVHIVPVSTDTIVLMPRQQRLELANKLNTLVHHSGWQSMDDVKISMKMRSDVTDPISAILEAIWSDRMPVDESNVSVRYEEIWTVLRCKYGQIVFNCKAFVNKFIWVCQYVKSAADGFQVYYDCFNSLLIKMHSMSPRFKCMLDALSFMFDLVPQSKPNHSVMAALDQLAEYTLTLGPSVSSKLSEQGTTVDAVDHETKTINEHLSNVYNKNVVGFTYNFCKLPKNEKWTAFTLRNDFLNAKINQLIPRNTTLLQYIVDEIDSYGNEIMGKWFYDLGFAYGVGGQIKIGSN